MKNKIIQTLAVCLLTGLMFHVGHGQVTTIQKSETLNTTISIASEKTESYDVAIDCGYVPTNISNVTIETVINDIPIVEEPLMSEEDIELIALVTMAEAEGECEYGKRLVIDTVLNRMDSEHFPDTAAGVVYQKNQFTSIWNGRVDRCYVTDDICQLVREELENRANPKTMFFTAGEYGKHGTPILQVGNHYFSSYD